MKVRYFVVVLFLLPLMVGCSSVQIPGFGKEEGPKPILLHNTDLRVQGAGDKVLVYSYLAERPEGSCLPWKDDFQKQGEQWHEVQKGNVSFELYDMDLPKGEQIYKCFARQYRVANHEPMIEVIALVYDTERKNYVSAHTVGTLNRTPAPHNVILLGETRKE